MSKTKDIEIREHVSQDQRHQDLENIRHKGASLSAQIHFRQQNPHITNSHACVRVFVYESAIRQPFKSQ